MNIVNSGNRFQIYGEDVRTFKELPVASYDVAFSKMSGFYLAERKDLQVTEKKIYGNLEYKTCKVMRSYKLADRNFGVLLSGQKGIGKSLFVRLLARQAINIGIPVIVVSKAVPGIETFISSIDQDCVVIFDEFEKTFAEVDNWNPQDDLLSLFDGIDGGHKLFIITCNDLDKISEYMINRPGRFHYHITIDAPSEEEVRGYLVDNVDPKYADIIENIVKLSISIDLPYDYLRAIVFEINQGYDIKEIMSDLNITRTNDIYYDVTVYMESGATFKAYSQKIDFVSSRGGATYFWVRNNETELCFETCVVTDNVKVANGKLIVDKGFQNPIFDKSDFRNLPRDQRDAAVEKANNDSIKYIELTKCPNVSVKRLDV